MAQLFFHPLEFEQKCLFDAVTNTLPYFGNKMPGWVQRLKKYVKKKQRTVNMKASVHANIGNGCVGAGEFCHPRASGYVCECQSRSLNRLWEQLGPTKGVVAAAEPNTPHR